MKQRHILQFWLGAAAAVHCSGCMDLNLLDEVIPADTASGDSAEGDGNAEDGTASGESGEGDEVPVADEGDTTAPIPTAPSCGIDERVSASFCIAEGPLSASIRFESDEPATVSIFLEEAVTEQLLSEPWTRVHRVLVSQLPPSEASDVTVQLADINGNLSEYTVSVTGTGVAAVALTEVLADPAGSEPEQEFVEVTNFGAAAVDLSGWMLDDNDDRNGDILPEGTVLEAGRTAILVPEGYRVDSAEDPGPAPSTPVIFLDGSLGSNGLKNQDAEPVVLYDGTGAVVSRYNGRVRSSGEGISVVRRYAEIPDGDPEAFIPEPGGSSSPGNVDFLE